MQSESLASVGEGIERYLARQPIFDLNQNVFGYELLFRSGTHNFFDAVDAEMAARRLLDNAFLFGLGPLLEGRKAFVNFTRESLLKGYPSLLPKEVVVVELLEAVASDADVREACQQLKQRGYAIALDDFRPSGPSAGLAQFADYMKIDWQVSPPRECEALVSFYAPQGIRMLAEKVETPQQFRLARSMGYSCFQGYFFCKPEMLQTRDIPGFKMNYLRILQEANRNELDLAAIERIFKHEPSLLFKLLRYLNSPVFGLRGTVSSVRHAITLLGVANLRRWISVVAVGAMAGDKPSELVITGLVRARFCELMAASLGLRAWATDLFLLGLLSLMEAILDRPMPEILKEIPVSEEVRQALVEDRGPFAHALNIAASFERGYWDGLETLLPEGADQDDNIPAFYRSSIAWAHQIFHG